MGGVPGMQKDQLEQDRRWARAWAQAHPQGMVLIVAGLAAALITILVLSMF